MKRVPQPENNAEGNGWKNDDSIIARHNRHNQKLHMVAFAFNLDGAFIGQFPPKLAFGGAVMSIWLALRNIL